MSNSTPIFQLARILSSYDLEELGRQRKESVKNLIQFVRESDKNFDEAQYPIGRSEQFPIKINQTSFLEDPCRYCKETIRYNWAAMTNSWYQNHRSLSLNALKSGIELDKVERTFPPSGTPMNPANIRVQTQTMSCKVIFNLGPDYTPSGVRYMRMPYPQKYIPQTPPGYSAPGQYPNPAGIRPTMGKPAMPIVSKQILPQSAPVTPTSTSTKRKGRKKATKDSEEK